MTYPRRAIRVVNEAVPLLAVPETTSRDATIKIPRFDLFEKQYLNPEGLLPTMNTSILYKDISNKKTEKMQPIASFPSYIFVLNKLLFLLQCPSFCSNPGASQIFGVSHSIFRIIKEVSTADVIVQSRLLQCFL